jgi:dTDP-glucose 4,6-dehydratase
LLARGDRVLGVDNFITGSESNVRGALESGMCFIRADVADEWPAVEAAIEHELGGADVVLHLASPASPVDYGEQPLATLRVNSLGTENAARCALRWGARFLFASTSEAYGDPLQHPQREDYWGNVNPVGVRACYDESKRYGEALVSTLVRVEALDARIVRIFNTYGPRMRVRDGRVVPNFITQALAGQPLTVYGDGSQTRSFCYVDDLVDGIMRVADSPSARGRVVNLGNPAEYTIANFAEIIARTAGVELKVVHRPLPPDDPARRCPDITLARELVGWSPRVELEEGLGRTIADFRSRLQGTAPKT